MQMIKITKLFILVGILFYSCENNKYDEHFSNGKIKTYEVAIKKFDKIILDCESSILLKKAKEQKVKIRISDNIINDVNLIVNNSTWLIDFKSNDNIATYNNHEFTIIIETPELNSIELESSGTINCLDTLSTATLNIKHNSSGKLNILSKTNTLNTLMDGSGILTLAGKTTHHTISHLSSGKIKAENLFSRNCKIKHDGSGDSYIYVESQLDCKIYSSGTIYYKGNPTIHKFIDGSGNLINY